MSDDRSSSTRKCKPDSSKPPHDARRSRDKRNHWANAAAPGTPRSTLRRERPLETPKAIGPWPLEAPSRPLREAAQLDRHTTFSATWDNGISLLKGDRQFGDVNVTAFANYGREHYDGGNTPSVQQYYLGGPTYGALGPNPFTAQYTGYNNSEKQTDMEYINLKADYFGFHFNDKAYTYSYWYPDYQNNPNNTATEGLATAIGGADTITSVKVP